VAIAHIAPVGNNQPHEMYGAVLIKSDIKSRDIVTWCRV